MTIQRSEPGQAPEVIIGVVGADSFINRFAAVARRGVGMPFRLVTAAYAREADAGVVARRIADSVDVLLFAGPLPYDLALAGDPLPAPATFVPTGGVTLPLALLNGHLSGTIDPLRVTIDSVAEHEVDETYAEIGRPRDGVRVMPYDESVSPAAFTAFHLDAHAEGGSSGAITTVPSVAEALREAGIAHVLMQPAPLTLRNALRNALLLGSGARLEESQIAIVLVELPPLPHRVSSSNVGYQDLRLTLHRTLLHEARRMDAPVLPRGEQGYLVVTTMGSLRAATDNLTRAPFLAAIRAHLSVDVEVGIGLGQTTAAAEENALRALDLLAGRAGQLAYLVSPHGRQLALPVDGDDEVPTSDPVVNPHDAVLRELLAALDATDSSRVVDADRVAQLQGVTLRTARRTLHGLVDAGLAWPLPPARDQKVGRPRIRYRLVEEHLSPHA